MALPLPSNDAALLAWLKSPPAPLDQAAVVEAALAQRRWEAVRHAIEAGALDPTMELGEPRASRNLIHAAVVYDLLPLLRFLVLDRGIDINQRDADGNTALHLAIAARLDHIALSLVEMPSIDLSARTPAEGITPLMAAAGCGLVGVLRALVARGVDLDEKDNTGAPAIVYAAKQGHEDAALYLVESGASWEVSQKCNMLHLAAGYGQLRLLKAVVQRMRADGLDDATMTKRMEGAAQMAVDVNEVGVLTALIGEGLDVKQAMVTIYGDIRFETTLLHHACGSGKKEAVAFLIEQGCDPLLADEMGFLPLHYAASMGKVEILQWLVDQFSILINTPGACSGTALHCAAANGHMAVVTWLIGQGANPLLLLVARREEHGANDFFRPSQWAQERGHTAIAAFLREHEQAAEAAAQAEQEAAARRARNEKRRQKQKKAKARRQQQEQAAAGGGGGGGAADNEHEAEQQQQQQQEQDEVDEDLQLLLAALPSMELSGDAEQEQEQKEEQQQEEEQQEEEPNAKPAAPPAPPAIIPAPEPEPEPEPLRPPPLEEFLELRAPDGLLCPISLSLLVDPVVLPGDGIIYSRAAIQQHLDWCRDHNKPLTSPSTNLQITEAQAALAPVVMARSHVSDYKADKKREWEALEQRWRAWAEVQAGQEQGV